MTDWITAIASVVTALSIVIIWIEFKADHEKARREKTCELMAFWTTSVSSLSIETRYVSKLIPLLDEHQCQSLWNSQPFEVDVKHESLVVSALKNVIDTDGLKKENGKIFITQKQAIEMRLMAANYFNMLEVIFCAWCNNIADKDLIQNEFGHLISPRKDYFPLDNLRISTGVFPSIGEFTKHIENEYAKMNGKRKIA